MAAALNGDVAGLRDATRKINKRVGCWVWLEVEDGWVLLCKGYFSRTVYWAVEMVNDDIRVYWSIDEGKTLLVRAE